MLLTQTAAGSEVEETVQDTVDTITGFNKFIQEKGPDLIAFGIRILMALLIFIICHKVIGYRCKTVCGFSVEIRTSYSAVSGNYQFARCRICIDCSNGCIGRRGSWSCPAGKPFQPCRWDADFIFEAFCCRGLYYRRQPWQ